MCGSVWKALGRNGDKDFFFSSLGWALITGYRREHGITLRAAWDDLVIILEKSKMRKRVAETEGRYQVIHISDEIIGPERLVSFEYEEIAEDEFWQ